MSQLKVLGQLVFCYFGLLLLGWVNQAQTIISFSRGIFILLFLAYSVLVFYATLEYMPKLPQDPLYHQFADQRCLCRAVPHASNVLTNIPFALVGLMGWWSLFVNGLTHETEQMVFYTASILTCLGSSYYHWHPTHATLVWDRLPMTWCTLSVFLSVWQMYTHMAVPLVLSVLIYVGGGYSVFYWKKTDDLRFYAYVQYYPIIALPLIFVLFDHDNCNLLAYSHLMRAIFFYLLARVVEFFDKWVYGVTNHVISGHSLKHLLAAYAMFELMLMWEGGRE